MSDSNEISSQKSTEQTIFIIERYTNFSNFISSKIEKNSAQQIFIMSERWDSDFGKNSHFFLDKKGLIPKLN